MTSKNDITGDKIQTKGILSKEGEENFDRIFKKKKPSDDVSPHTYEYELDKSTGEVVKVNSKRLTDAFNGH